MIKAIFFDVDGTLLSKENPQLSNEIIEAFNLLQNKNIKLFLATGRNLKELSHLGIMEQFSFDGYLTLNGGHCITDNNVIYSEPISRDDIKNIIEYVEDNNISTSFITSNDMTINHIDNHAIAAFDFIHTPLPDVRESNLAINEDIFLVNPFCDEYHTQELLKRLDNCRATKWHDDAYDIIPKNTSKLQGIKAIRDYYNISIDEMMAFGDGENDLEMLQEVGYAIVMENGADTIKRSARYICKDVNDNGVLDGLKHFGLI